MKNLFLPLIALTLFSSSVRAQTFELGTVTQSHGEVSFFSFFPPFEPKTVASKDALRLKGSYLTQDSAYFTVKLFEGSWLRISPRTKFTLDFDPKALVLTIHLYTGSLKALFSTHLNQNKLQKLVVKSSDGVFETVDGKFSVVRNPLTDSVNLYVEKGSVMAIQQGAADKKDVELVHAKETVSLKDRVTDIDPPQKLSEKELKFLNSKFYLKEEKGNL